MIEVVPYKAEHFQMIDAQDAQSHVCHWVTPGHAASLEEHLSLTLVIDGVVIGCGGLYKIEEHRSIAWVYLSKYAKEHIFVVHKVVKRFFDGCMVPRIEAMVDVDFEEGHRWVRMLGFELEAARMRKYSPDGGDQSLYARVS